MRRPVVAGNWKMNGSLEASQSLIEDIAKGLPASKNFDMIIAPAFVHLLQVASVCREHNIAYAGQNMTQHLPGAYTGEISGEMLQDLGCEYVLLGHSERRTHFHDSDALVADKVVRACEIGLKPILCVGESFAERESNLTQAVIERQLKAVLDRFTDLSVLNNIVIAYEPVWAIGTGKTASPEQAQETHAFIRGMLAKRDEAFADATRILYGGSVNPQMAEATFAQADVDGVLVGGASLDAEAFLNIAQYA